MECKESQIGAPGGGKLGLSSVTPRSRARCVQGDAACALADGFGIEQLGAAIQQAKAAQLESSLRELSVSISKVQRELSDVAKVFAMDDGFLDGAAGPLPEPRETHKAPPYSDDGALMLDVSSQMPQVQRELSDVARIYAMDDGFLDGAAGPLPEPRETHKAPPSSDDGAPMLDVSSQMPQVGLTSQEEEPSSEPGGEDLELRNTLVTTESEHHHNAILLPETWPSSVEMRWGAAEDIALEHVVSIRTGFTTSRMHHSSNGKQRQSTVSMESDLSLPSQRAEGRCTCYVIRPGSQVHVIHSCACLVVLLHDVIAIPWRLAWDVPASGAWLSVAWTTALFWTLDMLLNFTTGFYQNGEIVMAHVVIARKYLRSWLALDALMVAADWAVLLLGSSPAATSLRVLRVGKVLRLLSIFRLLKVSNAISEMVENSVSEFPRLAEAFVSPSIALLLVVHVQACIWFFIGRTAPSDTGMRWTGTGLSELTEETLLYQYTTSFHWSISQVTLGGMEITSSTSIERIYTVACTIEGVVLGSSLISACSSAMLQIRMDKRDAELKRQQLRRYLRENNVGHELAVMVQRQFAERLETSKTLEEDQVEGLKLLSSSLKHQLRFHLYGPHLIKHSLFFVWINLDKKFTERFCIQCMDVVRFNKEDDMFMAAKEADGAHFLISGTMEYVQEPESSPVNARSETIVQPGLWLAESAIWTCWMHVGSARALEFCEAMEVRVEKLGQVLRHATIVQVTFDYCTRFHRRVQLAKPPESTWPNDLHVPQGDESLADEVRQGRCTVMLNSDGEVVRVTSVVALKIFDYKNDMLIQIGKRGLVELEPQCELPGAKQHRGERVKNTIDRLFLTKLAPLKDHVEVASTERVVQWNDSLQFGVRTKYIRHVVTVRLKNQVVLGNAVNVNRPDSRCSQTSSAGEQGTNALAVDDALWQRDVWPIADNKGGLCLYAWFSEQDFEKMAGDHGKTLLPHWLSRLGADAMHHIGSQNARHHQRSMLWT